MNVPAMKENNGSGNKRDTATIGVKPGEMGAMVLITPRLVWFL